LTAAAAVPDKLVGGQPHRTTGASSWPI